MRIRHSTEKDFTRIMEIYAYARNFMAEHGNPNQWGPTNWPPADLITEDIKNGNSYVCVNDNDQVIGTFYYIVGEDIEPTYSKIQEGCWKYDGPYGVIHRLASDGSEKGIGPFCIEWAYKQCGHLRIDTHTDNKIMQRVAERLGFVKCGIIHVVEDNFPRYAYEKSIGNPHEYTLKIKSFDELTTSELYEILRLRAEIFVVEQDCPYQDLDCKDYKSIHIFYENNIGEVMACARVMQMDEDTLQLGRVVTKFHGIGLGGKLLKTSVEVMKNRFESKLVYIEAQSYAAGYYAKVGFQVASEEFLEDGIPHVRMLLDLEK